MGRVHTGTYFNKKEAENKYGPLNALKDYEISSSVSS